MSNVVPSVGKAVSDPIGYVTGKVTGDPGDATGALKDYKPYGFSGGGLSGQLVDGTFQLTRSPELQSQLGGLQSALSARATEFANLRKGLRRDTGELIGGLKERGIEAISGKRRRAIGDLRENLARRRVAGSSFAEDALSRAEAEFGKQEADFGAQMDVQQFQLEQEVLGKEMQLVEQETQAKVAGFQSQLTQLNLESGIAAQLSTAMSGIAAENARAIGQIMAEYAAARANIVGTAVGAGTSALTGGLLSDRRAKKDIEQIDKIGPLPVYKFKYLWSEEEQIGFMAQDVEAFFPDCIIENGFKYINYTKLRKRLCH